MFLIEFVHGISMILFFDCHLLVKFLIQLPNVLLVFSSKSCYLICMLSLEILDVPIALPIHAISQSLQLLLMSFLKRLNLTLVIRLELLSCRCMVILHLLDSFLEFFDDLTLTTHESIFLPSKLFPHLHDLPFQLSDLLLQLTLHELFVTVSVHL